MTLRTNFRHFLDEEGKVLALTEQAKIVFKFLSKIVLSVSENIEHPLIQLDVKCNTRATALTCEGSIEATCSAFDTIDWHCDSCEASGTISNWYGSQWDRQARILH
ncbi:hypothetical protein [Cognaticolwellia beringensis]|uniref:Uncharacterized protein n=1 Tax=Cognaticolwellia beringensis TaxID=1967665 RepID=A0A222GAX8_9GAMM|nr:hypothetical protein [Cognaticolwellia beringensis]ASP48960.1 hypothetical protein B5D82_14985 [Cognaticolwellia beringensis]